MSAGRRGTAGSTNASDVTEPASHCCLRLCRTVGLPAAAVPATAAALATAAAHATAAPAAPVAPVAVAAPAAAAAAAAH